MSSAPRYFAGIEAGGTKWLVAIAQNDACNIIDRLEVATSDDPDETISQIVEWLRTKQFDALGIASFGPVDLNKTSSTYGFITFTPKVGWKNTDVVGRFKEFNVPIEFETDVNATALCETTIGGHDVKNCCYITVGTGVGVGVCIDNNVVHGYMHPEGGHILVPLSPQDIESNFQGVCPYHGSCVEGMVASRAIASRTGLDRCDLEKIPDDSEVWDIMAHYLAHLCANLTFIVSPEIIVLGGGLMQRKVLLPKIREKCIQLLGGYVRTPPIEKYIVSTSRPDMGLVTALELARLIHLRK